MALGPLEIVVIGFPTVDPGQAARSPAWARS